MHLCVGNRVILIILRLIDGKLELFHHHVTNLFDSNELYKISNDFAEILFCIIEEIKLLLIIFDIIEVLKSFDWVDF